MRGIRRWRTRPLTRSSGRYLVTLVLALSSFMSPPSLVAAGSTLMTEMMPAPAVPLSEPIRTPPAALSESSPPDVSEPPGVGTPAPAMPPVA
jgi:hypothetical protein